MKQKIPLLLEDIYAALLRRIFLLPNKVVNIFAYFLVVTAFPLMRGRNYKEKVGDIIIKLTKKDHPYLLLMKKVANANPGHWRAFAVNLVINRMVFGFSKYKKNLLKKKTFFPAMTEISITGDCNLNCKNCYADSFPKEELPIEVIDRIIEEGRKNKIFIYNIIGGEPFLRNDMWQIYEKYPEVCFLVFSNGTLITEEVAKKIADIGNMVVSISIDGFEKLNDERRGKGTFKKAMKAMQSLAKYGVVFSNSVTVSTRNFDEVLSDRFVDLLIKNGSYGALYVEYMPSDSSPDKDLVISTLQRYMLRGWVEYVKDHYPLYTRKGEAGADELKSCDAAIRHIHIKPNGDVEPCPFCPLTAGNIKDSSIREIFDSDVLNKFRKITSELGVPCVLIKNGKMGEIVEYIGR